MNGFDFLSGNTITFQQNTQTVRIARNSLQDEHPFFALNPIYDVEHT